MNWCCVGRLLDIRFCEQDIHAVSYGFQVVGEEPCVAIECLGHIAVAKHVCDVLDVGAAGDGCFLAMQVYVPSSSDSLSIQMTAYTSLLVFETDHS